MALFCISLLTVGETACAASPRSDRKMTACLLCLWCCMCKHRQHERYKFGMVSKVLMDRPRHPTDAHGPSQRRAAAGSHRAAPPWARSPPALGTAPPEPPPSTPADALARTSSTCAAHAECHRPLSWCPALACLAHLNPTLDLVHLRRARWAPPAALMVSSSCSSGHTLNPTLP